MMFLISYAAKTYARVRKEEEGQTLVEYGLLAFLIAIAAVLFLLAIGIDLTEVFDRVENSLGFDAADDQGPTGDDDQATNTAVN